MPLKGRTAVDKAIKQTKIKANNDIRAVYFTGLAAMIKQTPVDEGRARNNWFLTAKIPFSLTGGRGKSKAGTGSSRSLKEMPLKVLGTKIYFTNNLPYIETLEYGGYPSPVKKGTWNKKKKAYEIRSINTFSKQVAPDGWVRKTLKAMASKIRQL